MGKCCAGDVSIKASEECASNVVTIQLRGAREQVKNKANTWMEAFVWIPSGRLDS